MLLRTILHLKIDNKNSILQNIHIPLWHDDVDVGDKGNDKMEEEGNANNNNNN